MARTIISNSLGSAVLFLACVDDDNTTFKEFKNNYTLSAVTAVNKRAVSWNGHTVYSVYDSAQASAAFDVTMSAGTLVDPGCVLALVYNQSAGFSAGKYVIAGETACTPTIGSFSTSLYCWSAVGGSAPVGTTTHPGSGATYMIAFNFSDPGDTMDAYYAVPGATVTTADNSGSNGFTMGNSAGHVTTVGYSVGTGSFIAETVLVAIFNRQLTTTELTNIAGDPYGTLFAGVATTLPVTPANMTFRRLQELSAM